MAVQMRFIGPANEVDRIVAAIRAEVRLDHTNAVRTGPTAGGVVTLEIVGEKGTVYPSAAHETRVDHVNARPQTS